MTALELDTVLFAPVGAQPLKPLGALAAFDQRVAMTQLAIAGERGFQVSLADAPQPGGKPNYTLETLRELQAQAGSECRLFCLMGADSFANLRAWRGAAEIPFAASLVVASRPGEDLGEIGSLLPEGVALLEESANTGVRRGVAVCKYLLQNRLGQTAPFYLLSGVYVDISASQIRAMLRSGGGDPASNGLLPSAVADYLRSHAIYRDLPE